MDPRGSRQVLDNINILLGQCWGVLRVVFRLLPLLDLKNVLLVCRLWRETGEPLLWRGGVLKVTRENMASVLEALGDGRRLQVIRKIRAWEVVSEELLQAMVMLPGLRAVDMTYLSAAEPKLLARVLTRLEEVNMSRNFLTTQLAEVVLAAVCGGGSRLKTLKMCWTELSSVDAGLLARVVSNVEHVNIGNAILTKPADKGNLNNRLWWTLSTKDP